MSVYSRLSLAVFLSNEIRNNSSKKTIVFREMYMVDGGVTATILYRNFIHIRVALVGWLVG